MTVYFCFSFIEILAFTCDFNFALANETENVVNNDDSTFVDSELVNREIVSSVNNKNNDIDNVNSLNIVNNCCANNFCDSFQIDACNQNNDHETRGMTINRRKKDGYKNSSNAESVYLFLSLH